MFSASFRNLGLDEIADVFGSLVGSFAFPEAHRHREMRLAFVDDPDAGFAARIHLADRLVWETDAHLEALLQDYADVCTSRQA